MKTPSAIGHGPSALFRKISLWVMGGALMTTLACNEITSPLRPAGYGYTLIATDLVAVTDTIEGVIYHAGETITDTVDFKWELEHLPVTIWVEDTFDLPAHMAAAIAAWKGILVYGEVDATIVSDSIGADIIVRGAPAPPPAGAPGLIRRLRAVPAACEGATDVVVSRPDHNRVWLSMRMYILPKYAVSDPNVTPCLRRVAAHELGHALGLFQHSPDPDDLMYGFPTVDAPSERDIATILWVYHQPTRLRPAFPTPEDTASPPPPPPPPDTILASPFTLPLGP